MFDHWSILKRVSIGFTVVLVLVGASAGVSIVTNTSISRIFDGYRNTASQTLAVNAYIEDLTAARIASLQYRIKTSDDMAAAVRERIAQVLKVQDAATEIFSDEPENLAMVERLAEDARRFDDAFQRMIVLQAQADEVVRQLDELPPSFEKALNAMMFAARMSGDQKTTSHVNSSILAFTKALGNVRAYFLTNDADILDLAYPKINEARSEIDSAFAFLNVNKKNVKSAEQALALIDQYRALLPEAERLISERNAIRSQELDSLGPSMQAGYKDMLDKVVERQRSLGELGASSIEWSGWSVAVVTLIGLMLGIVLAAVIGRWIASAVERMARAMTELADGRMDIDVRGADYPHELGRMARALKTFRDNAARIKEMEAENAASVLQAEEQRQAMMASLQTAFGEVVDAAVAGNFSRRVDVEFKDETLKGLASGVNRLVESVDGGLAETRRILTNVAEGDLRDRMRGSFAGAFADLQCSVNATIDQLEQIAAQIQTASREIDHAASEISSGTDDLSKRTERAASSLVETAASTEQMAATVKQNAENALHANELATGANQSAKGGGEVVEQTVSAMSRIEQSAQKITNIISVIDEIAFQTNLLALNASVEAARAGEAGKGFAVVAQEVRQLAQRSAQAAADIKVLIHDSNGQVQDGVELVNKAGETLVEIVGSIGKVAGIVKDISQSSDEQASGVEEINGSVASMEEMTQQNAALVEESTAAARALSDQSRQLTELMAFFKLGDQAARHRDRNGLSLDITPYPAPPAMSETQREPAMATSDGQWGEF